MRYLCCACHKQFPSKSAIDGFGEGYKTGFLCPHCRANLDAHIDLGAWLRGEGQPLLVIILGLMLAALVAFRMPLAIPLPGIAIPLWLSFLAAALLLGIVLGFRQPQVLLDPLMHTKRVLEALRNDK